MSETDREKAAARAPIEDALPGMAAKELAAIHANAVRLADTGAPRLQAEAARLLPLIEAEMEKRRASAPAARARKTPARKTVTRKKADKKAAPSA